MCFADEGGNKHDDNDEKITIRGSNVSARILGRSGKIMVLRNEKDDDDDKDDKDNDNKDDRDGTDKDDKDDSDSKDDKDNRDGKDSRDDKDGSDGKDDTDDDKDDEDDDDDDDDDEDFNDNNENLLTFELDGIEEKDADDNDVDDKHSVDSFDDVKFTFGKVNKKSTLNGIRVTTVSLSTNFDDQKASLEIIVYLFNEPGSVKFGNETFAVQSGTVKFNIKVSKCSQQSCV